MSTGSKVLGYHSGCGLDYHSVALTCLETEPFEIMHHQFDSHLSSYLWRQGYTRRCFHSSHSTIKNQIPLVYYYAIEVCLCVSLLLAIHFQLRFAALDLSWADECSSCLERVWWTRRIDLNHVLNHRKIDRFLEKRRSHHLRLYCCCLAPFYETKVKKLCGCHHSVLWTFLILARLLYSKAI